VLARYGFAEAWTSKITIGLVTLSFLPFIVFLVGIYLANNPMARMLITKGNSRSFTIDVTFFLNVLETQSGLALVLTSWIAPQLLTFDLADGALPLLLSRPVSRFGYVLGKFLALFTSLSLVTWIPCLLLFAYQSYSSAQPWAAQNLSIAGGLLAGSLIWIILLSIFSLALSAWVKWKIVATGAIFAAVLVPAGVGAIVSAILRTRWGFLLNLPMMMSELLGRMLGAPEFIRSDRSLPTSAIAAMLVLTCLISLAMLNARIRAREVVRG
jgi:ABC-type transport system involved in multi-copper enzyme maturation permease subunit